MRLSDLLLDDWVALPLEARDLEEAVGLLVDMLVDSNVLGPDEARSLKGRLVTLDRAQIVRVNGEIVLVAGSCEGLDDASVLLGISREPFTVSLEGGRPPDTARALILLLTPAHLDALRDRILPTLVRALRNEERTQRLLAAGSAMEIRALSELVQVELRDRLLVEDALTPLRYRIYPDTPLLEVVDLMVRRGLRAVPVVGESYEVLGILTVGDALKHLLPRTRPGEEGARGEALRGPRALTARDIMTRTVLCVSEGQSLLEAANLMVNRDVEQLPVVRDGELVGFLTRDAILRVIFGTEGGKGSGRSGDD